MRPLRYSINVTLDGCCDHRAMFADEDLFRHVVENLDQADALLFGRVTVPDELPRGNPKEVSEVADQLSLIVVTGASARGT